MKIYDNTTKYIKNVSTSKISTIHVLPSTEWPLNKTCAERSAATSNSIIYYARSSRENFYHDNWDISGVLLQVERLARGIGPATTKS
jgi:hypothetical protein